jgi:hypothetical protein
MKERSMRAPIAVQITAVLTVVVIGLSTSASATTFQEAVRLCQKYGGCSISASADNKGWNIKKGHNYIHCPDKGQCQCIFCAPPPQRTVSGNPVVTGGSLIGVLGGKPAPKNSGVVGGGILDNHLGAHSQGPAAAGSPVTAPAAPAAPLPVIIR